MSKMEVDVVEKRRGERWFKGTQMTVAYGVVVSSEKEQNRF